MTDEEFDPTELEDLALDLDEFCKQRPPAQQAALKKMFGVVADHSDDITGGDQTYTTSRRHEDSAANTAGEVSDATVRTFYVMGVPTFTYLDTRYL